MTIIVRTQFIPIKNVNNNHAYIDNCKNDWNIGKFMLVNFGIKDYIYDPCPCCEPIKIKFLNEDNEQLYNNFLIKNYSKNGKITIYMVSDETTTIPINIILKYNKKEYSIKFLYPLGYTLGELYNVYLKKILRKLVQIKKSDIFCFGTNNLNTVISKNTYFKELLDENKIVQVACTYINIFNININKRILDSLSHSKIYHFLKETQLKNNILSSNKKRNSNVLINSLVKQDIDPIKELQQEFIHFDDFIKVMKKQIKDGRMKYPIFASIKNI